MLPPADLRGDDKEIIGGCPSWPASGRDQHLLPAPFGSAVEMVIIDPADLEAPQAEDLIMHEMQPVDRVLLRLMRLGLIVRRQLGLSELASGFFWPPPWPGLAR